MSDPIRAPLDKASAVYCHADGECPCATPDDCPMHLRSDVPAKMIAAFLRALPTTDPTFFAQLHALAAAVLAAAKDQTHE